MGGLQYPALKIKMELFSACATLKCVEAAYIKVPSTLPKVVVAPGLALDEVMETIHMPVPIV